jgi:hypothetical protein
MTDLSAPRPTVAASRQRGIKMRKNVHACVLLGVAAAICCMSPTFADQPKLYKHVDEKGVVTYTDRPQTAEEKRIGVANTAKTGDRTKAINANMKAMSDAEKREWRRNHPGHEPEEYGYGGDSGSDENAPHVLRPPGARTGTTPKQ